MGASMRYLSQRYAMPYDVGKAVLTDIGTEELAHLEIVAAIVQKPHDGRNRKFWLWSLLY